MEGPDLECVRENIQHRKFDLELFSAAAP